MIKKNLILLLCGIACTSPAWASVHNVRDYGAKGDGVTIDSPAINAAIDAAAREGGGVVYLPAGRYASYSVRLASHVHLYLEKGCVLLAAEPSATQGYDMAEDFEWGPEYQDYGHSHWKNSLIWGIGLEDIEISGGGMIDGSGLVPGYGDRPVGPLRGNKAISLKDCRNVTLKDFSMYECGHFALLATGVDNLTIRDLDVDTQRDGLDIDCCRNVVISGCRINSPFDDGLVLKASYGLGRFKDTEEVTISDCIISGWQDGSMLAGTYEPASRHPASSRNDPPRPRKYGAGRIKFGTESSGGFRNIAVTNCTFHSCGGILLETVDGGILEDVVFSNITMRGTNTPLFFRLGARMRSPENTPGSIFRRVRITDVNISDADAHYPIIISGIPGGRIEDISIRNFHIRFQGGLTPADARAIDEVPERENGYPEFNMFGVVPAKGIYLRHVDGVDLDGIHLRYDQPDTRPVLVADDVQGLRLNNITVDGKDVTEELRK